MLYFKYNTYSVPDISPYSGVLYSDTPGYGQLGVSLTPRRRSWANRDGVNTDGPVQSADPPVQLQGVVGRVELNREVVRPDRALSAVTACSLGSSHRPTGRDSGPITPAGGGNESGASGGPESSLSRSVRTFGPSFRLNHFSVGPRLMIQCEAKSLTPGEFRGLLSPFCRNE
jgi:hypothetical protein